MKIQHSKYLILLSFGLLTNCQNNRDISQLTQVEETSLSINNLARSSNAFVSASSSDERSIYGFLNLFDNNDGIKANGGINYASWYSKSLRTKEHWVNIRFIRPVSLHTVQIIQENQQKTPFYLQITQSDDFFPIQISNTVTRTLQDSITIFSLPHPLSEVYQIRIVFPQKRDVIKSHISLSEIEIYGEAEEGIGFNVKPKPEYRTAIPTMHHTFNKTIDSDTLFQIHRIPDATIVNLGKKRFKTNRNSNTLNKLIANCLIEGRKPTYLGEFDDIPSCQEVVLYTSNKDSLVFPSTNHQEIKPGDFFLGASYTAPNYQWGISTIVSENHLLAYLHFTKNGIVTKHELKENGSYPGSGELSEVKFTDDKLIFSSLGRYRDTTFALTIYANGEYAIQKERE